MSEVFRILVIRLMNLAVIALCCIAVICLWDLRSVFRFAFEYRSLKFVRRREHQGPLAEKVGARIALSGTYRGSSLESHWTVAQVSTGASPDASSTEAFDAVLETTRGKVLLEGALQVVLAPQRYSTKEQVLRTVVTGATILAEGTLEEIPGNDGSAPESGRELANYRTREVAYRLVPYRDSAWPKRPLAVFQIPNYPIRPGILAIGFIACCTFIAGSRGLFSQSSTGNAPVAETQMLGVRPCIATIENLLRAGNPWEAKDRLKNCASPELDAHTEWLLGHVAEAAGLFQVARIAAPDMKPTAAEVEALLSVGALTAPAVMGRLREEWYRGPETAQKRVLGCISDRLFPKVWGLHLNDAGADASADASDRAYPSLAYACTHRGEHSSNSDRHGGMHIHYLPAYALHSPTTYLPTYQWTFPNPAMEEIYRSSSGDTCESEFPSLTPAAAFSCEGSVLAQRLLFAALSKDESLYEKTLVALKVFIPLRKALPNVRSGPETRKQQWALESFRVEAQHPTLSRSEMFDNERNAWMFSIEKVASVVAAAAHHMGDSATRDLFLEYADGHPAGMMREHLRLVRGEDLMPESSHSPSDYSEFEMGLFAKVTQLSPEAFQAWLAQHQYGNPTRIEALVARRSEHLAAIQKWNHAGYVPLRHGPSYLELLHRTFERRRIAELAGDVAFAKQLANVGRNLSDAIKHNGASYSLIFAFETVVLTF